MKNIKAVTLLVVCALTASAAFGQQAGQANSASPATQAYKYKTPKLTRAQLEPLLAKPDHLLIIDVRRPDELTTIGGFPVYLSIQAGELEHRLAFIPKDRTIITVSNHAGRAGAAADFLVSKGFQVAGAVGVENYADEGGTLTKIVPPLPKAADAGKPAAGSGKS
ncbi:MAG: hypothetical protein JWR16_1582 [Nevskia sp.]|nr:hypothetical protein [Nevskia sp.]